MPPFRSTLISPEEKRVRDHPICALCNRGKAVGLVVCWPCYRAHRLREGNARAEQIIEAFGERLEESQGVGARRAIYCPQCKTPVREGQKCPYCGRQT